MNANSGGKTTVGVWIELSDGVASAGSTYVSAKRGVTSTVFVYNDQYLRRPDAIPISPDLPLSGNTVHTEGLPGAMSDSAPDRWGRNLIKKQFQAAHRGESGAAAITELDYLLGVSDLTRQGALRYTIDGDGPFEAPTATVPKLIELPRLMAAANRIARNDLSDGDAVKTLLAAGTASLGGARPKASVRDGATLYIAKFGHHHDEWDVMAWEMVALDIAESCGIPTPTRRLVTIGSQHVLLLERFDRSGDQRVPYTSAMSLVRGRDGNAYDYLEVAERLAESSSDAQSDLVGLWSRIALSVLLNNTDDHLRNHGFLWSRGGWRLSPVFDVNINPDASAERATSVNFVSDRSRAVDALLDVASDFEVGRQQAERTFDMMREHVGRWRAITAKYGISEAEFGLFAGVLDEVG